MKIIRSFEPGDRYRYDFNLCSCARGWAQVDTAQDASWFGTWGSPTERTILNFAEGDLFPDCLPPPTLAGIVTLTQGCT
jgi:hypothetical protein